MRDLAIHAALAASFNPLARSHFPAVHIIAKPSFPIQFQRLWKSSRTTIRQGLTAEMFQREPCCILSASKPQVEEWSTSMGDFI